LSLGFIPSFGTISHHNRAPTPLTPNSQLLHISKTMRPLLTRPALLHPRPIPRLATTTLRHNSTSPSAPATAALPPRWLSELKSRIGKCIDFGINDAQTAEAGAILQQTSNDWRELVAGSEGFLTSREYRGLFRQEVVWGEMVRSTWWL
jgi:hypothetical protein